MTAEGTFIGVISLLVDGLIPPSVVFDKTEVKVLSNNANFLNFIDLACVQHGKRSGEIGGASFETTNQMSMQS